MAPEHARPVERSSDPARAPSAFSNHEIKRFNDLASTWWDRSGPMKPLHVINALRLDYVVEQIARQLGRSTSNFQGLRVADIGCGAGLMCEPMASRGAVVVGIDRAARNISAARLHALDAGLDIDYRVGGPDDALATDEAFDVVLLLEVVEHVGDMALFVQETIRHLRPGGILVVSTINRTLRSFLAAIIAAEYVFHVLPRGTHHWKKFVQPAELEAAAFSCGMELLDSRGMRYLPIANHANWCRSTSVNYISSFTRRI